MKHFLRLFSVICLLSSVLCPLVRAAEPVELDPGLAYLRIHSLTQSASDLRSALLRPGALVLDLRYTADEPGAVDALRELNSQPAKPKLYVLVSPATPAAFSAILTTTSTPVVTLGLKDSHPVPQVVVDQTAEADRAAYAAYESGTALARLISGKIEKERFDEATLVHEFKNGNHDAKPPEAAPPAGKDASPAPAVVPLVDRVLQRAVHLHHALLALKR